MDLLERYRGLDSPKVIGLMSGTSVDALDAALVEMVEGRPRLIRLSSLEWPQSVREMLQEIFRGGSSVFEVAKLHWLLGEYFAQAAELVMKEAGVRADLIASHGQTIFHLPNEDDLLGHKVRATLQIGEGAVIAERTGCLTVCDFRPQDLACGGQGAPLVPFADKILFCDPQCDRIALNIGGMANITWIPKDGRDCLACDTGPGNAILDRLAQVYLGQSCDLNGDFASTGSVIPELLEELMKHKFLALPMPKSTGREEFGAPLADSLIERAKDNGWLAQDLMFTLASFTAFSIALHIKRLLSGRCQVLVGGGGINNRVIMERLRYSLADKQVEFLSMESIGVPAQAREAMAFALLGHYTATGQTSNLPSATGAKRPCVLGKIVLP